MKKREKENSPVSTATVVCPHHLKKVKAFSVRYFPGVFLFLDLCLLLLGETAIWILL